jgi:hypothetical protein
VDIETLRNVRVAWYQSGAGAIGQITAVASAEGRMPILGDECNRSAVEDSMASSSSARLDELILTVVTRKWQKVALVIIRASHVSANSGFKTSDGELAARIEVLYKDGRLESLGNLSNWRRSEVRLPGT